MSHNSDGECFNASSPAVRRVAALCVAGRSIYKHIPGVDAYDRRRDARTFDGSCPVVAHPPCRLWSKFLSHQAKPDDADAERELGRWCVRTVLKCGGVLEQPAGSRLWAEMGLPLPGVPMRTSQEAYSLYVEQTWFGYATKKPTWLLVVGVPKRSIQIPFDFHRTNQAGLSAFGRSRTVNTFAAWLVAIARRANPPGLEVSMPKAAAECQSSWSAA